MISTHDFELPHDLVPVQRKARKLELFTIIYLATVVVIMAITSGSSQAMKTAWIEDIMSMIPAIAYLFASHINNRVPNAEFPYGYHRIYSIAYLTGSVALFSIGSYLFIDSVVALVKAERASIGSISVLGHQVWLGWMMILALLYSAVPAMFIGKTKLPLAEQIHNKLLYADADTQKADWMTAAAAIVGIVLIGFGFWWADAAAAIIISTSVIRDGIGNVKSALKDLMDCYPRTVDSAQHDPLVAEVDRRIKHEKWVKDARVRLRESGQVYFGEAYVVPQSEENLLENVEELRKIVVNMHWKIHDITISAVPTLPSPNIAS